MLTRHACARASLLQLRLTIRPSPEVLSASLQRQWPRHYPATASLVESVASRAPESSIARRPNFEHSAEDVLDSDKDALKRKRQLYREIDFLRDPLKLADHTLSLLKKNNVDAALEIVKLASKDTNTIVSWNHIIDYYMSVNKPTQAWKKFNDMKKRGLKPDAYTYTILFRGLGKAGDPRLSLPRVIGIYNSMYADNSPVRPSTIHTNAVLRVCAKAGDIEALFEVAAKLPTRGKVAADHWTYTTILQAITNATAEAVKQKTVAGGRSDKLDKDIEIAVSQGRRIWADVVTRWHACEITMDRFMVNAMGKLLLLGERPEDSDDVLSLVEQTVGLKRQVRPWAEANRGKGVFKGRTFVVKEHHEKAELVVEKQQDGGDREGVSAWQAEQEVIDSLKDPGAVDASVPLQKETSDPSPFAPLPPSQYPIGNAQPDQAVLSLLLTACLNLRSLPAAQSYWDILTDPKGLHKIRPDYDNYVCYLRVLRHRHASRAAADLLEDMMRPAVEGGVDLGSMASAGTTKVFRLAMVTCGRDNANPDVLRHARRVLLAMRKTLVDQDPETLSQFLDLLIAKVGELKKIPGGSEVLVHALKDAGIVFNDLRSQVAYGKEDDAVEEMKERAMQRGQQDASAQAGQALEYKAGKGVRTSSLQKFAQNSNSPARVNVKKLNHEIRLVAKKLVAAHSSVARSCREEIGRDPLRDLQNQAELVRAWEERQWRRERRSLNNDKSKGGVEAQTGGGELESKNAGRSTEERFKEEDNENDDDYQGGKARWRRDRRSQTRPPRNGRHQEEGAIVRRVKNEVGVDQREDRKREQQRRTDEWEEIE